MVFTLHIIRGESGKLLQECGHIVNAVEGLLLFSYVFPGNSREKKGDWNGLQGRRELGL